LSTSKPSAARSWGKACFTTWKIYVDQAESNLY
jgi:hypothetical protein